MPTLFSERLSFLGLGDGKAPFLSGSFIFFLKVFILSLISKWQFQILFSQKHLFKEGFLCSLGGTGVFRFSTWQLVCYFLLDLKSKRTLSRGKGYREWTVVFCLNVLMKNLGPSIRNLPEMYKEPNLWIIKWLNHSRLSCVEDFVPF